MSVLDWIFQTSNDDDDEEEIGGWKDSYGDE